MRFHSQAAPRCPDAAASAPVPVPEPLPLVGPAAGERAARDAILRQYLSADEGELRNALMALDSDSDSDSESESALDPYPIAGEGADKTQVAQDLREVDALLALP